MSGVSVRRASVSALAPLLSLAPASSSHLAAQNVLVPGAADSQATQEALPIRLTLDAALEYAEGSNPGLRQARNRTMLDPVESQALWFNQLLPTASLTLFDTRFTGNLQRRALDNFGNPINDPTAEWNYFSGTTHRLGLNWTVRGPSLLQAYRSQQLTVRERELQTRTALTELQVEVQRLYTDALEQRELMLAEEELIESRRIDLAVAERLFELALRTRVDVLAAELEIEQQRLAHQRQASEYLRAVLALRTVLGLSEEGPVELVEEMLPLFDPSSLDADALVARARATNPEMVRSEVAVEAGQVALARQDADWWPQVDLGISIHRQAYQPYSEALFDTGIASDLESQFYIRFSIPILGEYFQHRVDRRTALVDLRNSQESVRQTGLEVDERVRGALLELENQWTSVQLSERSRVIAEEALRLAREEYRLGTRSFAELRASFEQEAEIRREVITARHAFVDALLTLEAAVGAPVREVDAAEGDGIGGVEGGAASDPRV